MTQADSQTPQRDGGKAPLLKPSGRARLAVFLTLNLAGFIAVNAFWQYLATGRWGNFSAPAYHRAMVTPLGEMLIHPLNVLAYPWMILVTGLLLGLVILVPLLVAVLYRLLLAALFVAVVAAVGHAPVLALALAAGCVLAARTPFRTELPFLATMVGLIPIAVYLYFFAFAGVDPPAALPFQKLILYAPFVVAFVSAVLGGALVLLLARWTGFRPGVVWPVLAVLLAAPIAIFYTKIGPGELEYGVLVHGLAPGGSIFDPVALDVWKHTNAADRLEGAALEERVRRDGRARRDRLQARCQAFLARHGDSPRAPAVQWIQAQCLSMQLDTLALGRDLVRYSVVYCLSDSPQVWQRAAPAWRALRDRYAASPQAALADWRLGELAILEGRFREGYPSLRSSAEKLRQTVSAFASQGADRDWPGVFTSPEPVPDSRHYAQALFEVEGLLWLIEQNRILDDEAALTGEAREAVVRSREALQALLRVHPADRYRLAELESAYGKTPMADNLALARVQATIDLDGKAAALLDLAERREGGRLTDAAVAARYYLGMLAMRPAEIARLRKDLAFRIAQASAEQYFLSVIEAGQQPWKHRAEEHLASLRQPGKAAGAP